MGLQGSTMPAPTEPLPHHPSESHHLVKHGTFRSEYQKKLKIEVYSVAILLSLQRLSVYEISL